MKTKKLLSVLLALMMMLSVVPFYASAAPIALTEANVVEWPTASGEIYYGQKVSDGITLSGGEVQYNGTVVAGIFEFVDVNEIPTANSAQRANIKFTPNDTAMYSGFEVSRSTNVTFPVNKAVPAFVDENDTTPVATEVAAGAKLSTSTLSGAKVKNPYNESESKALAAIWRWRKSSTVVNQSGYYEAMLAINSSYEPLYAQVYVRIIGDTSVAVEIEELPTVEAITYKEGLTAGDLVITGGKASVAGSFKVKDEAQALSAGQNTVAVVFVPEDTTINEVEMTLNVTVDKMPVYFIDETGNEIIPEIRIPFAVSISSSLLQSLISDLKTNYTDFTVIGMATTINTAVSGEYDAKIQISPKKAFYSNVINIKLIVEPIKILSVKYYGHTKSMDIKLSYQNAPGTYDVYVDGVLVGSGLNKNEYDDLECPYNAEVSGTHKIKLVYNKADANDTCSVDENEVEFTANAKRELSTEGLSSSLSVNGKIIYSSTHIYCGDEIDLECTMTDLFTGWEITDTDGNPVELEILTKVKIVDENGGITFEKVAGDLSCEKIIFTMPDYDIIVKAKSTLDEEEKPGDDDNTDEPTDEPTGGIDDIFGDLTEGDSSNPIVNIFNNILAWFRNLIETIKNFFRGIGDRT